MSADQKRVIVTDVLEQTVTIHRRASDGMVWLYAPQGVALDADEAWQVAQAMISDAATPPENREEQNHG
ncbi:hypothetical protein ACFY9N_11760 [Microbacterium sp. NPDC008134]|uniref:hypothetical protein n=1 Tax=Microbacterium sp. NPDC008134 TaxID=3364183 RepID=UPI0036EAA70C